MGRKIKCALFSKGTTESELLTSNGLVLDRYVTDYKSTEELDTGYYVLDVTFLVNETTKQLTEENILKVLCDYGDDFFYITKVKKSTRYFYITARQLTIDKCLGAHLEDVRPTDASGQGAMSHLQSNTDNTLDIRLHSDITKTATAYYEDKSLYEALWDSDNSFINRWGGETQRRGFDVYINSKIGIDRNVRIIEGKNLNGFNANTNIDEVYCRVRGKGFDGIKGNWVTSDNANKFAVIKSKTYEYKVRVREEDQEEQEGYTYFDTEAEAKAELDRLAKLEFTENHVDELKATYDLNFVQLEQTSKYKDYIAAERCYLGDTLSVYVPTLDINLEVRVVSRVFNHLTQKVESLTLCNYTVPKAVSIADIEKSLNKLATSQASILDQAKQYSSDLIKSGLKNSYVVVRKNEILVMDTQDINTATKVWLWTNGGLGFSSTGYDGTYGLALTRDGQIVADRILTGTLKAIEISNMDGSFRIDLGGYGGADFYCNKKKSLSIAGNKMDFYNWGKDGDYIGSIGSVNTISNDYPNGDPNRPNISIWNDLDSSVSINYKRANTSVQGIYVQFDKYNIQINHSKPIKVNEGIEFSEEVYCWNSINMHGHQIYLNADGTAWITNTIVDSTYNSAKVPHLWSDGKIWASAHEITGGDYAEAFEWKDANKDNEDRIGYLVELEGDKIKLSNGDNTLGIVTGTPSIIGDNANEWQGKYKTDKWGRYELDCTGSRIINDNYDKTREYKTRSSRQEWGVVGLIGKVICRDDGTASIGDYITASNGIATKSNVKTRIKMMSRIDDETIRVFVM